MVRLRVYAPEFSLMRVLRFPEGPLKGTDPAERLITFEDYWRIGQA